MIKWRWIRADTVFAIHDKQLADHGGADGIRDINLIHSALARPQQLQTYGKPPPDIFALAAAYAYGIAKNHGFVDGNKRTAWILARLFIADNGGKISYTAVEAIKAMEGVAGSSVSELALAQWLRERSGG